MSQYDPPAINSNIFNDSYFTSIDGALTIQTADLRYLKLTGGVVRGDTTFSSNLNVTNTLTVSTSLSTPIINSNQYLLAGASVLASALTSITPGTAAASKALVLDASSNIASIGTISQTVAAGGDVLSMSFTTASSRCSIKMNSDSSNAEFGIRGSAAGSFPNSYYMYSNGSYKWVMSMSNGDSQVLSTTDSFSVSTGALVVKGGLACVKNVYVTGTLTLDRNGSNLSFINGSNTGLIELAASPNILRISNGFALNIGSAGVTCASSSIAAARYALDMQATAADIKLCLFQSGANGTYGLGANSSRLIMCSGGQGHGFYKSSTGGSLGTLQAEIDTNSNFIASNNLISGVGLFIREGFSSAGLSGNGLKLHCATAQTSEIFAYNYSTATFKDIKLSNSILCNGGSGFAGIGFTPGDIIAYPWAVNDTISSSIPGSYGYLASGGSGSGSGTGSVQVSIYASGRMFATEFDAYSDRRLKHNIEPIDSDLADRFIEEVEPVQFEWRNEDAGKRTGYIAQQLLGTGLFQDLVTQHIDDKMTGDHESPEGYSLSVQYNNVAAILHQAIKNLKDKVNTQEELIKKNTETIESLVSTVQFLKDLLSLRL